MKRFCCWCGKMEYTKTCQSKSLKKAVSMAVENVVRMTAKKEGNE